MDNRTQSNPRFPNLLISVKLVLKIRNTNVWRLSYFGITRVFRNGTHLGEMASDALWVVSFKSPKSAAFKVLKKIGEKGYAFSSVVNERGQFKPGNVN